MAGKSSADIGFIFLFSSVHIETYYKKHNPDRNKDALTLALFMHQHLSVISQVIGHYNFLD